MNITKEQDGMAALIKAAEEAEMNRPKPDTFLAKSPLHAWECGMGLLPESECDNKSCTLEDGECLMCGS